MPPDVLVKGSAPFLERLLHSLPRCFLILGTFLGIIVAIEVGGSRRVSAQVPDDSARMTPLVRVIRQVEPAAVALFIPDEVKRRYGSGTATLIHPDGYAITNNHVVNRDDGLALLRGKPVRFSVVGRSPEKDLAVILLRDHQGHLPTVPIGHSHDVLKGESVAVIGNPGGRGIVVTAGIISSIGRELTSPNALFASQYSVKWRDDYIQYDAATNRGNSGGPLINMDGQLIGVVAALLPNEQNSSFAIPIDRVRAFLHRIIEPEIRHGRSVGISVNPQADETIITEVEVGSAADQAGVRVGDVIVSVETETLTNPADWLWSLDRRLPGGEAFSIVVRRGEKQIPIRIKPEKWQPIRGVEIEDAESVLQPGLRYEFFEGEYEVLPDFDRLKPARTGVAESLEMKSIQGDREDYFAVRLSGLMKVAKDGLYRLNLHSDDGSRLHLHGKLWIDHDGNHPPMTLSRMVRFKAGLHPIELEYFEGYGENILELKLESLERGTFEKPDAEGGSGGQVPEFLHLIESSTND